MAKIVQTYPTLAQVIDAKGANKAKEKESQDG
jgi:hypothetical protein